MIGPLVYAAASTSIRAGLARLLPQAIWTRLLATGTVDDVMNILKQTSYQSVLPGTMLSLEEAEKRLQTYVAGNFLLPFDFLTGKAQQLVYWMWTRFEVNNLISLLRAKHRQIPPQQILSTLIDLGNASTLNWQSLANAGDISSIVNILSVSFQGRYYAHALEQALHQYQQQGNTFFLEVSLHRMYYRRLLNLIRSLNGRDERDARMFIGNIVDSRTLLWAYRYKIYFQLTPEDILSYTLPYGLRVDAGVIQRVATGTQLLDIVDSLWGAHVPGSEHLRNLSLRKALILLELLFRRYEFMLASHEVAGYPFHLGFILAYAILVQIEVDDLITVLEGKSAGWPETLIQDNIIARQELL